MKKLLLLPLLLITLFVNAQGNYQAALGEGIKNLWDANTPDEMQAVANQITRIADAEPKEWLPAYYAAHARISASFMLKDPAQRDAQLDQAQAQLEKALKLQPQESELYVLQGFYNVARMMVSPNERYQKHGTAFKASLEKAKSLNPENPRIYYMLGNYTFNTPPMVGGGPAAAKPILLTAKEKFAVYKPASSLAPNWGEENTLALLAKCE